MFLCVVRCLTESPRDAIAVLTASPHKAIAALTRWGIAARQAKAGYVSSRALLYSPRSLEAKSAQCWLFDSGCRGCRLIFVSRKWLHDHTEAAALARIVIAAP